MPSAPTFAPNSKFTLGVWPMIAAGLCMLSLGLPWVITKGTDSTMIPGYFVPGFCRTVSSWDGWASTECDSSFVAPPIFVPGYSGGTGVGAEHTGRFGLVGALAAIALARRKRNRTYFAYGGAFLLFVSALSSGVSGLNSGVMAGWSAAGILLWRGGFRRELVLVASTEIA